MNYKKELDKKIKEKGKDNAFIKWIKTLKGVK